METLVILAVVVWVLFKLVQKVTSKLYPPDSVKVQEKPDTTPATDAREITLKLKGMSFYSSSTGVSRRCGSKQLKRLIRSTAQGSGGVYVTGRSSATAINVAYAGEAPVTEW